MTLANSLINSLIGGIVTPLTGGTSTPPVIEYVWNLDGTNYGETDPYRPADATVFISITVKIAGLGSDKNVLGDTDSNKERIQLKSGGSINFIFVNASGSRKTVGFPVTAVTGGVYRLEIDQGVNYTGTNFRARAYDQDGGLIGETISAVGSIKADDVDIEYFATNNQLSGKFDGEYWGAEFGSDAAGDRRLYPMNEGPGVLDGKTMINSLSTRPFAACRGNVLKGNGVDVSGSVAAVVLAAGDTISLDLTYSGTPAQRYYLDGDATGIDRLFVLHNSSGNIWFSGNATCTLNGVAAVSEVTPLVVGANSLELAITSDARMGVILSRYTIASFAPESAGNIKITKASGDTYEWLCNNIEDLGGGQGKIPNTGSTGSTYDMTVNNYDPATDREFTVASDDITTINTIDWVQK